MLTNYENKACIMPDRIEVTAHNSQRRQFFVRQPDGSYKREEGDIIVRKEPEHGTAHKVIRH